MNAAMYFVEGACSISNLTYCAEYLTGLVTLLPLDSVFS